MKIPKEGIKRITVGGEVYFFITKHEFSGFLWLISIGKEVNPDVRIHLKIEDQDPILDFSDQTLNGGQISDQLIEEAIRFTNKNSNWQNCDQSVKLSFENGRFKLFMND